MREEGLTRNWRLKLIGLTLGLGLCVGLSLGLYRGIGLGLGLGLGLCSGLGIGPGLGPGRPKQMPSGEIRDATEACEIRHAISENRIQLYKLGHVILKSSVFGV